MKIWYDKSKLDLNTFNQEKFLFLPLFDKEVVDRDYNFKNNKWVDVIADQVEYTSMEDADYFVYHDKFNDGIAEFIKTTQNFNHKPILAFYNDDDSRTISKNLPDNVYVFRTSINKSKQSINEFALPAWSSDLLSKFNSCKIRDKIKKPVIGFCGALTNSSRVAALDALKDNNNVETNFIIRNSFWGGKIHDEVLREEYIQNMIDSDIILCCRGAGNFSFRLYECMSLGKIPLIIDTDISLPCSDKINWSDNFIVTSIDDINKNVNAFWGKIGATDYMELQSKARYIYESLLSPAGFTLYIASTPPFRDVIRSSGMGLYDLLKDKENIIGAEIGCFEGVNANFLLETLPQLFLHGIDPYDAYIDWNGLDIDFNDKLKHEQVTKDANIVFSKYSNRFKLHKLRSDDAVDNFKDGSLDFVFVDGLHTYEQTLKDCKNYLPKIKSGGIICGHDYGIISGVTKAVDEFSATFNKQVLDLKSTTRAWYWIKD